jgi:hypothetical protein
MFNHPLHKFERFFLGDRYRGRAHSETKQIGYMRLIVHRDNSVSRLLKNHHPKLYEMIIAVIMHLFYQRSKTGCCVITGGK